MLLNPIRATAKTPPNPPQASTKNKPLDITLTAPVDMQMATAVEGEPPKRATFSIKGYTGAVVELAGWYYPVIVDLTGLRTASQRIPALLNHDHEDIVGMTDVVKIESSGVTLDGVITDDGDSGQKVVSNARNGFLWQASIGARPIRQEFLKEGAETTVNGRKITGPVIIAREALLREISFCALGADDQTSASVSASTPHSQGSTPMTFEQWLQARAIDPASIPDAVRTVLQATWELETSGGSRNPANSTNGGNGQANPPSGGSAAGLDEIFRAHRNETERQAKITSIVAEAITSRPVLADQLEAMARTAIEGKETVQQFELNVLRLRAGTSSAAPRRDSRVSNKAIEAALCVASGLKDCDKHFDEQTLELADSRFKGNLGLRELLVMAARENGYTGFSSHPSQELLEAAFRPRIQAGFSTISLPGILSNTANKFLLQGFMAVEQVWRQIASKRSVRDFKQITSYSLTGGMIYDKVGPAGELKHGGLGETAYTNQAASYGKILGITRADIINDDLNALSQIPMRLGRGAALKLNIVFWTEFLANVSSFWTGSNAISGGGSALSSGALKQANSKFKKANDYDGNPLGITPKILLTPSELETDAEVLMTSMIVNTGGSSTTDQVPNKNVWANKFTPVSSAYLSNPSIPNYSATAWWLLADPAELSTIEVAFLNGRETPIVESTDADFDTLGIKMRGYHDFGVSKQESRASVRAAGQ